MTHTISVTGTDIRFACPDGTTILDAAQASGWELPYSCRKGVCSSCRGGVSVGRTSEALFTDGTTLFCQAKPLSDVEIAPTFIKAIDPNARKVMDAKLYQITRPTDDVAILQVRFPMGKRVKFRAGQFLEVILEGGERRSYSMANPPHQNDGVELHIRAIAGGYFSENILPALVRGAPLKLELPFGNFGLKADSERPVILVASGTGFAPIKSIIEDQIKAGMPRPLTLYWGARTRRDLYAFELAEKWAARFERFRFIPVLSESSGERGWEGRVGLVHRAVMEDHASLARHEVYVCGVPAMVNAARQDFVDQCGLPPEEFLSDAFVTPADAAK